MRKKTKNILKITSVLLVALFMASTAAVAITITNKAEATRTCFKNYVEVENENTKNPCMKGGILWDNGPFDDHDVAGRGNAKGTTTYFGKNDLQVADDFEVPPPGWLVSDGHMEGLCINAYLQIDYVTVEFFEGNGTGLPKEIPFYTENSYSFTENDYPDANWPGRYYAVIDVNFGPVPLSPGTYWVKMQPYGCPNNWFYQGSTTVGWGNPIAVRDGPWGNLGYGHTDWLHDFLGENVNFQLTGDILISDLQCTGALSWNNVNTNSIVIGNFTVANIGDAESELDWEVGTYPSWGTWTFNPPSGIGLTPADGAVTVHVSCVAPSEVNQEFTGEIKVINKGDPSDFCTIQVRLVTPKNRVVISPLLFHILERLLGHYPLLARLLHYGI